VQILVVDGIDHTHAATGQLVAHDVTPVLPLTIEQALRELEHFFAGIGHRFQDLIHQLDVVGVEFEPFAFHTPEVLLRLIKLWEGSGCFASNIR